MSGDEIEAGKAAWLRIKDRLKSNFGDWLEIGRMLIAARALCMKRANCNKPYGPAYQRFIREWLEENGLQEIDSHERRGSIVMVENVAEIEAWRSKLTDVERRRCNHPNSVLAHWRRRARPTAPGPKTARPAHSGYHGKLPRASQDLTRDVAAALRKNWSNDTYALAAVALKVMLEHRAELLELLNERPVPVRRPAIVKEPAHASV